MAAATGKCGGQLGEPGRGRQKASPSKAEFHMHVSGRSKTQGLSQAPVVVAGSRGEEHARKVVIGGQTRSVPMRSDHIPDLNRSIMARSERFELPTLGFEVRCSIQLSYERASLFNDLEERPIS